MKLPRRANLLFVFQTGYGFIQLPLGLFSFATTIYYLLVNNVPWLKVIFPEFWIFLIVGGCIGLPTCLLIGQWYIQSPLNKASTRTHPFSTYLIPTQFPSYMAQAAVCRKMGLVDAAVELEKLVEESKKKW